MRSRIGRGRTQAGEWSQLEPAWDVNCVTESLPPTGSHLPPPGSCQGGRKEGWITSWMQDIEASIKQREMIRRRESSKPGQPTLRASGGWVQQ